MTTARAPTGRALAAAALALTVICGAPGSPARAAGAVLLVTVATDDLADPPVGSLRRAIERLAAPGDTIRFDSPIQVDLVGEIVVPPGLAGLRIEGPGGVRAVRSRGRPRQERIGKPPVDKPVLGRFSVFADGVTLDRITFRDVFVSAAGNVVGDELTSLQGMTVTGCTFLGNGGGVSFDGVADGRIEGCTIDVSNLLSNQAAIELERCDRGVVVGNKVEPLELLSSFAFADVEGRDLLVERNEFHGPVFLQTSSATVRLNEVVAARLDVLGAPSGENGQVVVEENEASFLRVARVDTVVRANKVTADDPRLARRVPGPRELGGGLPDRAALSVSVGVARSLHRGPVIVRGNEVSGGAFGLTFSDGGSNGDDSVVEDNVVRGATRTGVYVATASALPFRRNRIEVCGAKDRGIGLQIRNGAGNVTVEDVEVLGTSGRGIDVANTGAAVRIERTRVANSTREGIVVGFRDFVLVDGAVEGNGRDGVLLRKRSRSRVTGTTLRGNAGAGVFVDAGALAEIRSVGAEANAGLGIDLAPRGVTANAKRAKGNEDAAWPEDLVFDAAARRLSGRAAPGARIDVYAVEEGPRAGNPLNGEGAQFLGNAEADGTGAFTLVVGDCPASGKLTLTATEIGFAHNKTSEFSEDVACESAVGVELISIAPGGAAGDAISTSGPYRGDLVGSGQRCVSAGGRFVVFGSRASNLAPGHVAQDFHVYLRDTQLGTTMRLSTTWHGGDYEPDFHDFNGFAGHTASVSDDGRFVAYQAASSEVPYGGSELFANVVLYDAESGRNVPVTDTVIYEDPLPSGEFSRLGGTDPSISGDGSVVAFVSGGSDLDLTELAPADEDVFVWTRATGAIERVSTTDAGGEVAHLFAGEFYYPNPRVSFDGRFVAFAAAQPLVPGNSVAGPMVFLRDRQSQTTEIASVDASGAARRATMPQLSDDGRYVVFVSREQLVAADVDALEDVYLRDRQTQTTTLLSVDAGGAPLSGYCRSPTMSGDGRFVAFVRSGSYQPPGGFQAIGIDEVILVDRVAGTVAEISGGPAGEAYGPAQAPALSRDGRSIVFQCNAGNVVPEVTTTDVFHVYLRRLPAIE